MSKSVGRMGSFLIILMFPAMTLRDLLRLGLEDTELGYRPGFPSSDEI